MSKESYIGGDYIETTGGSTKIYATEDIENSSAMYFAQNGDDGGVVYGNADNPPDFGVEIEEIYWAFGEENERIKDYSKHYVDLNLVVKVKNAKPGDFVKVKVKSEDGGRISDESDLLSLSGIVLEGNEIIFKQPLKYHSMILLKD